MFIFSRNGDPLVSFFLKVFLAWGEKKLFGRKNCLRLKNFLFSSWWGKNIAETQLILTYKQDTFTAGFSVHAKKNKRGGVGVGKGGQEPVLDSGGYK